jgi:hypothetical protein
MAASAACRQAHDDSIDNIGGSYNPSLHYGSWKRGLDLGAGNGRSSYIEMAQSMQLEFYIIILTPLSADLVINCAAPVVLRTLLFVNRVNQDAERNCIQVLHLSATLPALSMWPGKLKLGEKKSKHASLDHQNGCIPAFLHHLKAQQSLTRVIDWLDNSLGPGGLLSVVSHLTYMESQF